MKKVLISLITFICIAVICLGAIRTVQGEETLTVEGEWEMVSSNTPALQGYIGQRLSILKKSNGYEVKVLDGSTATYTGNEARIARTVLEDLSQSSTDASGKSAVPPEILRQVAGQKAPINIVYTLSTDGSFLNKAVDYIEFYYTSKSLRFDHYDIQPGFLKMTFKRISGTPKVDVRSDRAYQADCGKTDPNRTTPITTDLCPGNLACMTYFCGGGMGCSYVCCPKGLPYLNHCDCKCYAAPDFECHSHSQCLEQPRQ